MKKDFIKKLDEVLNYFYDKRQDDPITDPQVVLDLFTAGSQSSNDAAWDYKDIINQLHDDKFIVRQSKTPQVMATWGSVLTHTGRFFKENGGYKGKFKRERFSKRTKIAGAIFLFLWGAFFTVLDRINDGKKETLEFENKAYKKNLLLIPKVVNELNSTKRINGKSKLK